MHNPRRNVLLATVIVCIFTGLFAGLQVYLAQRVCPDYRTLTNPETAFMDVAQVVGGYHLFAAFGLVLFVSSIAWRLAGHLGAVRLQYGMGRDNLLPKKVFGYIDPQRGNPTYNVMIVGVLAYIGTVTMQWERAVEILNFGALLAFISGAGWGGQPFPGKHACAFAKKFAEIHTTKYGQCVNTGTVAIQAALKAIGIQPGDEVIAPAYAWEGTVGPVLLLGAVPVFVDVDPDTYCLDAKLVEEAITPKTKAILPVHLGMRFADMDELLRIAQKHNLKIIEDCAYAHGGIWKGKGAGSMGDLGAFSFQSSKLLTCGEAGAVITNNLEYMEQVQSYINAGRASVTDQFHRRIVGFNYRLGEFQAAVLGAQLERLPAQSKARDKNMAYFETRIKNKFGVGLLKPDPRITRLAPYGYVIKYFSAQQKDIHRASFVAALQLKGIPCDGLFYEPVYKSSFFPVNASDFPAHPQRLEAPDVLTKNLDGIASQ